MVLFFKIMAQHASSVCTLQTYQSGPGFQPLKLKKLSYQGQEFLSMPPCQIGKFAECAGDISFRAKCLRGCICVTKQ